MTELSHYSGRRFLYHGRILVISCAEQVQPMVALSIEAGLEEQGVEQQPQQRLPLAQRSWDKGGDT